MAPGRDTSIVVSALWMIVLSMALFFVPTLNGLIGGLVGGYKAGSASRAMAAGLSAIVAGGAMWIAFAAISTSPLGSAASTGVIVWVLPSFAGLVVGALIGGAVAPARSS